MIFYHVDRANSIKKLKTINLFKPSLPDMLNKALLELFPDGISNHGYHYAIQSFEGQHTSTSAEQIFELYRQLYFPNKPSRFQSFFAFTSIEDAMKFAPYSNIYEVKSDNDNYHIGDMNLVKGETIIQCHKFALDYWSGHLSNEPLKEVLLVPPIRIDGQLTRP